MKSSKTPRECPQGSTAPLRSPNGRFRTSAGMIASQRLLKDSKQLTGKTSQRTSTPIGRRASRKRRLEEADDAPGKKSRKKLIGNNPDTSLFNSEISVIEQHDSPTKHTRSSKDASEELSMIQRSPSSSVKTGTTSKAKDSPKKQLLQKARKSFQGGSKRVVPQVLKKCTRVQRHDDSLLSKTRMSLGNEPPCLSVPVYRNKRVSNQEDSNANASKSSIKDLDVDKSPVKPESQRTETISNPKSAPTKPSSRRSKQRFKKSSRRRTELEKNDVSQKDGEDFSKHDFSPGRINTRQRLKIYSPDKIPSMGKIGHSVSSPQKSSLGDSSLEVPIPHPESSTEEDSSLLAGTSIETSAGDSIPSDIMTDTSSSIEQPSYSLRRSHQPTNLDKRSNQPTNLNKVSNQPTNLSKVSNQPTNLDKVSNQPTSLVKVSKMTSQAVKAVDPEPQVFELFSPPNLDKNKTKRTTSSQKLTSRSDHEAQERSDTRLTRSNPTKAITNRRNSINKTPKEAVSSSETNADDGANTRKHGSISKPQNPEIGTTNTTVDIHKKTANAHVSKDTKGKGGTPATNVQDARSSVRKTPTNPSVNSHAIPDQIQERSSFMIPKKTIGERESRKTRSGKTSNAHDDAANKDSTDSPQSSQASRKLRSSDDPSLPPTADHSPSKTHKETGTKSSAERDQVKSPPVSKYLSHQIEKMRNHKTNEAPVDRPMPLRYMLQKDKHRNQIKKKINDIVDSLGFASDEESLADLVGMHSSSMEDHSEESSVKATEKDPEDATKDTSDEMDSIDDPDEIFLRQIQLSEEPSESSLELKSPYKSLPPKKRLKVLFPRRRANTSDSLVHDSTSDSLVHNATSDSMVLNSTADSDVQPNRSQDSSIHHYQRETTNGVIQPVPKDATKKLQRRTSPRRVESKWSKDSEIKPYHSPVRESSQGGITLRSSRRLTTERPSSVDSLSDSVTSTLEHPYGKLQIVVVSDTSTESHNSSLSDSGSKELNLSNHSTHVGSGILQKHHDSSTVAKSDLKQQRTLNTQQSDENLVSEDVQHQQQLSEASSVSSAGSGRPPLITDPIFSIPVSQGGSQQRRQIINMGDASSQEQPSLSKVVHLEQNGTVNLNTDMKVSSYGQGPTKKKAAATIKAMAPHQASALSRNGPQEIVQSSNVVSNAQYIYMKQVTAPSTTSSTQIPFLPILPASTVIQGPLTQPFPQTSIIPPRHEGHLVPNPSFSAVASATIPVMSPVFTHNYVVNTVPQLTQNIPNVVQPIQSIQPFTVIQLPTDHTVLKLTPLPVQEPPKTVSVLLPQGSFSSQVLLERNSTLTLEPMNQIQLPATLVAKAVTSLPQRPTVITKPVAVPSRIQTSSSKTHSSTSASSFQPSGTVILSSGTVRTSNVSCVNTVQAASSGRPTVEMNHGADSLVSLAPIKNEPFTSPNVAQTGETRTPQAAHDTSRVMPCSSIVKDEPIGVIEAVVVENIPVLQPSVSPDTNIVKNELVISKSEPTVEEAVPFVIENVRSLNQEAAAPVQTSDAVDKESCTPNESHCLPEATPVQSTSLTTEDVTIFKDHTLHPEGESRVQQPPEDAQDAMSLTIASITEFQAEVQSMEDQAIVPESIGILAEDALENIENTEPLSADQFCDLMEECSKIVSRVCIAIQGNEPEAPEALAEDELNPTDLQAIATLKSTGKETPKESNSSQQKPTLKKKQVRKPKLSNSITKSQVIEIPKGETARTIVTKPSFDTRHERIDSATLNHKKKKRWILNTEFESLYRKVRVDLTQNPNTNVAFITTLIERTSELVDHASDADVDAEADEVTHSIKESVPEGTSELIPTLMADTATSKKMKTKPVKNQTSSKQSDIQESNDLPEDFIQRNIVSSPSAAHKPSASTSTNLKKLNEPTASSIGKKNSASSPVTTVKRAKKLVTAQEKTTLTNVDDSSSLPSVLHEAQSSLIDGTKTSDSAISTTQKMQPTSTLDKTESFHGATAIVVTTASEFAKTTSMITELKKTTATIAQLTQTTTKVTSASKAPTMSIAKATLPPNSVAKATLPTMMTPVVPRFLQATAVDDLPPPKGRRISRVKSGPKPPNVNSGIAKDADGSLIADLNSNNNNNKTLEYSIPSNNPDFATKDTPSMDIGLISTPGIANKDSSKVVGISQDTNQTLDESTTAEDEVIEAIAPSEPVVPATPDITPETDFNEQQPKLINASDKNSHDPSEKITRKSEGKDESSSKLNPRSRRSSGKSNVASSKSSLTKPTSEKAASSKTVSDIPHVNPSSPRPTRRLRSLSSKSASHAIPENSESEMDPGSHKEKFLKSLSLTSNFDDTLNDSSMVEDTIHEDEPPVSKKKASNVSSKDQSPPLKPFSKEDLSQTESNVSRILKQIELRQQTDQHATDVQIPQKITPDKSRKRSRSNFNPAVGSRKSSRKLTNNLILPKADSKTKDTIPNKAKSSEIDSEDPKGSSKEQTFASPSRLKQSMNSPSRSKSPKKKSKSKKDEEPSDPQLLHEPVPQDSPSKSSPEKSSTQKEAAYTLMKSPEIPVKSTSPSTKRASQRDPGSRIIPTLALPELQDRYSHPAESSTHALPISPSSSIPNTDLGYSSQSLSRSSSISDISNRSFSKPRMVQKTLFDFNIGDRRKSAPPRPLVGVNERRITRTIIIYDESTGTVSNTTDGACQTTVEDLERTLVRKISKSVTVCDSSCQTSDLPFTDMVNGTVCGSPLASGHTSIGTSPIKQPQPPQQQHSTDASTSSPHSKGSSTGPDDNGPESPQKSKLPQNILNEYENIIDNVASNIPESPTSSPFNTKKAKRSDLRKKVLKKSGRKIGGEDSAVTSATESDLEEESHQSPSNIGSPDHSVVLSDVDQTVNMFSSPGYQSSLKLSEEIMSSADETGSLPDEIEFGASTDEDEEAGSKTAQRKSRKMIVKLPGLTPKKNQGSPGSPEKNRTSDTKSKERKRIRSPENMESSRKRLMLDYEEADADPSNVADLDSDPEMAPVDVEDHEKDNDDTYHPKTGGAKTKKKKVRGRPSKKSNRGRKPTIHDDSEDGDENSKMVKCMNCEKDFPCLKDLKTHMMMSHTRLYTSENPEGIGDHSALKYILKKLGRLICSACGKTHRNIQYYTFHQKWCGKEEEMSRCEECNKMVQSMWLQQHYREHRNREHFLGQKIQASQQQQQENKTIDGKRQAAVKARTNLHDLTKELLMPDSDDSGGSAMGDGEYVGMSDEESSDSGLSGVPERQNLYVEQTDFVVCKRSFGDNHLPMEPDFFEEIVQWYQNHHRADHLHKILLPVKEDWIALTEEGSIQFIPKYKQSVQFIVSQHRYEEKRKISKPNILDWSQSFVTRDQATSYCGGAIDAIEWCPLPIFKSTNHYAAVACHMTRDQPIGLFNPPEGYSLIHIWSFGQLNPLMNMVKPILSLTLVHDYNIASSLCWCPQGTWQNPAEPVDEENVYHRLALLAVGSVDGNVRIFSVPHPFEEENIEEGSEVKPPKLYQPKPSMILKTIENSGSGSCVAVSWQNTTSCDCIIAGYANGIVRVWNITATSPLLVSYTESGIKVVHPIKSFFAHSRPIRDVSWNPKDGNVFATSGDDKRLRIWRLDSLYKDVDGLVVGTPVTSLAWPLLESGLIFGKDNIYLNDRSHTGFHDCGIKPSILRYSPTNHHGAIVDVEFCDWHNILLSCDSYGAIKGARFRDTSFEEINIHAIAHREFSVYMTDIRVKKAVRISTEDESSNIQTNQSSSASSQNNQTSSASSQNIEASGTSSQDNQTSSESSQVTSSSSQENQTSSATSQNTQADSPLPDVANENGGDNHVTNTDQSKTSKKKVDKYDYHSYKETDEKCCLEFIDYPLTEVKAGRKKKISGKIDIKKLPCFPIESLKAISVSKNVFGSTWLLSGGEAGFLRLHNMSGVMAAAGRQYMEDKIPKES